MDWTSFFIVFLACAITMLICRVVPVFALKGRELPANAVRALNLIPPAAFAALIANDLLSPTVFANGPWPALIPAAGCCARRPSVLKTPSFSQ